MCCLWHWAAESVRRFGMVSVCLWQAGWQRGEGSDVLAPVIGLIAAQAGKLPSGGVLFLKTGVCGGFTTFSTFSLETVMLLQNGRYGLGVLYIILSLGCCLAGVAAGLWLGGRVGQQ